MHIPPQRKGQREGPKTAEEQHPRIERRETSIQPPGAQIKIQDRGGLPERTQHCELRLPAETSHAMIGAFHREKQKCADPGK